MSLSTQSHAKRCLQLTRLLMLEMAKNGQRQMDTLQHPHIGIRHAGSAGHQSSVGLFH